MQIFGSPNLVCLFLIEFFYLTILFVLPWLSLEHFVNFVFKGAI